MTINAYAVPSLVMAFVTLTFATNEFVVLTRRKASWRNYSFVIFCVGGAFFSFACTGEYTVSQPLQSLPWLRFEVIALAFTALGLLLLVAEETGLVKPRYLVAYLVWTGLTVLSQLLDLGNLSWVASRPFEDRVLLPFGLEFIYREVEEGPIVDLLYASSLVLFAYLFRVVWRHWRAGRASGARAFFWVLGILCAAQLNDIAVTIKLYSFIYLTEYAWVAAIILIAYRRSADLFEAVSTREALQQSEEALQESRSTLSAILESTSDMIWSVEREGYGLLTFNAGLRNYFLSRRGISIEVGMRPEDLFPTEEFIERWKGFYRKALTEGAFVTEYEVFAGSTTLQLSLNVLERKGQVFGISIFGRDITENKRAEEDLRESEKRFRNLFEQAPVAMTIARDGAGLFANPALLKTFGYASLDEVVGRPVFELFAPRCRDESRERTRLRSLGLPVPEEFESVSVRADGSEFPVQCVVSRVKLPDGDANLAFMTDITERRAAEESIRRRNEELATLNKIGQTLSRLAEPKEILETIFAGIGRVMDNSNLFIALNDVERNRLSFPIYMIKGLRMDRHERVPANGITEHVIRTGLPFIVEGDIRDTLARLGIDLIGDLCQSFMAVPIHAGDRVLGVIALQDYDRENVYDGHDLELLTTIATQASIALENARLFGTVQRELGERTAAEQALKESESRIRGALEEKETLLREVHHRVKNNLQVIIALINMKGSLIHDEDTLGFLRDLEAQAHTMSLVYEQLYQSENLSRVDMGPYLEELTSNILGSFGGHLRVRIRLDASLSLDVAQAMPCGLIVNELATNILKHAFPEGFEGEPTIDISMRLEEGTCHLVVGDNGAGFPPDFDWRASESLGLKLVDLWATHQLGGSLDIDHGSGTRISMAFRPKE